MGALEGLMECFGFLEGATGVFEGLIECLGFLLRALSVGLKDGLAVIPEYDLK